MSYNCEGCREKIKGGITQFKIYEKISLAPKGDRIIGEKKVCFKCWKKVEGSQ